MNYMLSYVKIYRYNINKYKWLTHIYKLYVPIQLIIPIQNIQ